ncbi:MAG TPA: DUF1127 domain-containing protein [Dongiaceae bacterium]
MSQLISSKSNSFRLQVRTGPSLGWPGQIVLAIPRAFRRAWAVQREKRLLQDLSDYQLRDVGLRRDQISYMLKNGWDR